jgi:hypothetical protein
MSRDDKKKYNILLADVLVVILFFVSVVCAHYYWFMPGKILQFGDWGYRYSEYARDLFLEWGTWSSAFQFGANNITLFGYPIRGIFWSMLVRIGFGYEDALRFGIFIPVAVLGFVSPYIFAWQKTKNRFIAGVLAFFYSSIPYFLVTQTAHLPISFVFAASPLLLIFFEKAFVKKNLNWWIAFVMFFALCSAYEVRISFIVSLLLGFYYFVLIKEHKFDVIRCRQSLAALLIFLLLQSYWLLTILETGAGDYSKVADRGLFGNNLFDIFHSWTIAKWNWTGQGVDWSFNLMPVPIYLFAIPILVICGYISLIIYKKEKYSTLYFCLLILLGVLLTKQSAQPFSNLYLWVYDNVPGFNLFREASKLYLITAIGYFGILTLFLKQLLEQKRRIYLIFISCVLTVISIVNLTPFISQSIDAVFVSRNIPVEYLSLNKIINYDDREFFFRTLWVPRSSNWVLNGYLRPRVDFISVINGELSFFDDKKTSISKNEYTKQIASMLRYSLLNNTMDLSSVRYIGVPLQDKVNNDDFFMSYGGKENPNIRQWYIDELDKVSWLKKIDIGTKDLVIYENENYKPHVYAFRDLIELNSYTNLEEKYNFITNQLNKDFYFSINDQKTSSKPLDGASSLFESLEPQNLNIETKSISDTIQKIADKKTNLYINKDNENLRNNIFLNGEKISNGEVALKEGENIFEYKDPNFTFENVIENPSFENGTWKEKVGDCNNKDDNPILAMNLNGTEKTDGNQSLQLEATRHIACTSQKIPVKSQSTYLFSFDYQTPNAKTASYNIGFNDEDKTTISESIDIKDGNWNTFSKTIKVPEGADSMTLHIYARSIDEKTNIINRYDNFKLIEIPDLSDVYYLVSESEVKLEEPKEITFDLINPTKKLVHIKGATTPFYLAMSESYHPQWQAQMNNQKIQGAFDSWLPLAKPDRIGDEYHYKLNGFLNGWYVDTEKVCQNNGACTKNPDGTYDIEMVIEFFPQRWFYLGLLISGTTLISCLGYLTYDFIRRRKNSVNI